MARSTKDFFGETVTICETLEEAEYLMDQEPGIVIGNLDELYRGNLSEEEQEQLDPDSFIGPSYFERFSNQKIESSVETCIGEVRYFNRESLMEAKSVNDTTIQNIFPIKSPVSANATNSYVRPKNGGNLHSEVAAPLTLNTTISKQLAEQQKCLDGRTVSIHQNAPTALESKKLSAMDIACELARNYHFGVSEGNVYIFNNNHYMLCDEDVLEQVVYMVLKNSAVKGSGYRFFQDICKFLKLETRSRKFTMEDIERVRSYIGFKNGYFNLNNFGFYAPDPNIFITNYLDVNYDELMVGILNSTDLKSIECPNFDRFIAEMANHNQDVFDRIYQMIGYIISNDCAAKKLFVLSGVSDSGKSKLGEFIISLFNDEAVTSIPIGELGERFSIGDLPGKALCVDLDLPATKINAKTAAKIKSLTGGDTTSAENKFENRRKFVNRAKLLYATNHPIEISEKEYVLRNRFVSIPITRAVPKEKQIANILDFFKTEKFAIIMKGIGYYCELVKRNYEFIGNFELNEAFIDTASGIVTTPTTMIERFVEDKCIFTSLQQWTYTDILYKAFCNYYKETAVISVDYNNFSRLINYLYVGKVDKGKKRREGSVSAISIFKGIIMQEEIL